MLKKFTVVFFLAIFSLCNAEKYRGSSIQKLDNGMSVVFVDTTTSDSLLVILCISSGNTDEIYKSGVASLLNYMFTKKLKESTGVDSLQYGSESDSFIDHDKCIYYFYGKHANLEEFIKTLGTEFSDFAFSSNDVENSKHSIEQRIINSQQIDKNLVKCESKRSMYWHSNYGTSVLGSLDDLKSIYENDIREFKNKNYTNNRATLVIAGNVDKSLTINKIMEYFGKGKTTSPIDRVQEPIHHESTTKITKYSSQINVPVVELYWRIPNYRNQKDKALAAEIFVNYLNDAIQKKLVENQKIISSAMFDYSFWNYDYGDLCITVTLKNSSRINEAIAVFLKEIKLMASNGLTKEQASNSAKKLADSAKVFNIDADVLDSINWISKKISSGNDFDFIKSYSEFVEKFDLNKVNVQAEAIFQNDPCVISVIKPAIKKDAI